MTGQKQAKQGKKKPSKTTRQLRAEALKTPCPKCEAKRFKPCRGVNGQKITPHKERIRQAMRERDPLIRRQRIMSGKVETSYTIPIAVVRFFCPRCGVNVDRRAVLDDPLGATHRACGTAVEQR